MIVRLSKTFRFEAAHDLPTFPADHKCRRLHGHSFRFDVVVEGEVEPAKGYLIDYGDIKKAAEPLVKRLDHYYLNEIEGLSNPTSEVLAKWLFDRLKPALPLLAAIIVYETCTSMCEGRHRSHLYDLTELDPLLFQRLSCCRLIRVHHVLDHLGHHRQDGRPGEH